MNYLGKRLAFYMSVCAAFTGWIKANNSVATAMAKDKNNKIVLGGFADNGTNNVFALARLNLDGSPDVTFNPSGNITNVSSQVVTDVLPGFNSDITAITIDSQNRIVATGPVNIPQDGVDSSIFGSSTDYAVVRYNNDGTLDLSFNPSGQLPGGPGMAIVGIGRFNDVPLGIALDSQDRIVIVGSFANGTATDIAVVRLTPDGALDRTFSSGILLPPPPESQFGTTLVIPGIAVIEPGIQVITINGNEEGTCVAIGDDDSIFISGSTTTSNTLTNNVASVLTEIFLAKVLNNGSLDQNFFNPITSPFHGVILQSVNGVNDSINAIGIDVNHSLVLGGYTTVNGPNNGITNNAITNFLLVRYTQTGDLFETVQTDINSSDSQINALTFDANNKIVVSGSYNNGTMNFNFLRGANLAFVTARYNLDGSLDPTFNPGALLGDFHALPGIVITNVIPPSNASFVTFTNNDNAANGVVTDSNNNIYVTGYSNDGFQRNFTTLSYVPDGGLNVAGFNAEGATNGIQAGSPGEVLNIFFGELQPGNGIPLFIGDGILGVGSPLLESLRSDIPEYVAPVITAEGPLFTSDPQPVLNGTAPPNAAVTLLVNDIPMATVDADALGNWSAVLPKLVDGIHSVVAIATDPLTGISPTASEPVSLTILTEAPEAPRIDVPSKEEIVRTSSMLMKGKAQPETVVTIFSNDQPIGEVETQASGTWSFQTPPLAEGPQSVYALSTDKAGNKSIPSEIIKFKVDTGKSQTPRILIPKQGVIIKKSPITIKGEGKPNSSIKLFANEKAVATVKIDKDGKWAVDLPVTEGHYEVYGATADNKLKSETLRFSVDFTPVKEAAKAALPVKGLFSGFAEPGSTITLVLDGVQLGKTVTDELGSWSFNPRPDHPIEKGRHLLRVSITGKDGKIRTLIDREISV